MWKQCIAISSLGLMMFSGCSNSSPSTTATHSSFFSSSKKLEKNSPLYTGRWIATEINGFRVQSSQQIPQIKFNYDQQKFTGSDGCNHVSGHFNTIRHRLKLTQDNPNAAMCLDPNSLIATQYQQALDQTMRYRVSSTLLILLDQDGRTLAAFTKTNQ